MSYIYEQLQNLLLIIRSLLVLIYFRTFSQFLWNPSVSPHADCEPNSVHR